jgi:DNA-binding winged helix-turn-helix (wHTH) protein/tetratricopeptide (TPR) repeat protein
MIYQFGPFSLDARERVLRRDGEPLRLGPRVFDILLVLVQNSGRVLTKQELTQLVWRDIVVEESNLTRNVSTLRKALGNGNAADAFIETIPWRGYRFIAPVRRLQERRAVDSMAVLPFANDAADAPDYLADGITEALINKLSQASNLRVMSRYSIYRYQECEAGGRPPEASAIGRDLKVRAVLIGRIRQEKRTYVVSVELIDTADDSQLWGAQYRRKPSDTILMHETIAADIADYLGLQRTSQRKGDWSEPKEANREAHHLTLRGRFFLNKMNVGAMRKALELFQQAVVVAPDYAPAYAGLLDAHLNLNEPAAARKAAMKALQLDPHLAEAHASLAFLMFLHDWEWRSAETEFLRALDLNPNCAQARQWYGLYLAKMGRLEEAIHEIRHAQQLDPLSLPLNMVSGLVLCFARQFDLAIEELRKTIELEDSVATRTTLGLAYAHHRMCDEAIAEFKKASAIGGGSADVETFIKGLTAYCYATCGKSNLARPFLNELSKQPSVSPYMLGMILAQIGEHARALDCLERAYKERHVHVLGLKVDPALDPLRSAPRFQRLLARVGLA